MHINKRLDAISPLLFINTYIETCIHKHTCMYTFTDKHLCTHKHTHAYMLTSTHMHICVHTHRYTAMHTQAYACIHINMHSHAHMYSHTCARTHTTTMYTCVHTHAHSNDSSHCRSSAFLSREPAQILFLQPEHSPSAAYVQNMGRAQSPKMALANLMPNREASWMLKHTELFQLHLD